MIPSTFFAFNNFERTSGHSPAKDGRPPVSPTTEDLL